MPLTDTDPTLIRLWSMSWTHTGLRDQRVTAETGLSPTRAAQRLVHLLDDPEARAAFPVEMNRLDRIRSQFQRSRRAG